MAYRELVDKGATKTELQSFLVGGDMVATTIRIPENLKNAIAEEAALKGISFSAQLRICAINDLSREGSKNG